MRIIQPRWSFVGAQLFVAVTTAAVCYLVYAALQTFFGGLPVGALLASIALLILEILALGSVDLLHLRDLRRAVAPRRGRA